MYQCVFMLEFPFKNALNVVESLIGSSITHNLTSDQNCRVLQRPRHGRLASKVTKNNIFFNILQFIHIPLGIRPEQYEL